MADMHKRTVGVPEIGDKLKAYVIIDREPSQTSFDVLMNLPVMLGDTYAVTCVTVSGDEICLTLEPLGAVAAWEAMKKANGF